MPVRTVHTCSFCKTDIQDAVSSYQLSGPGVKLNYDVCPTCTHSGIFAKVVTAGETRRRGRPTAGTAAAHGNVAGNGKPGRKKAGQVTGTKTLDVTGTQAGEVTWSCPDCDYTSHRPQSIGLHRAKLHGYVSPQRRVKV